MPTPTNQRGTYRDHGIRRPRLRRTFISHLILSLVLDPVRVAKIAGHSRPSVTSDL